MYFELTGLTTGTLIFGSLFYYLYKDLLFYKDLEFRDLYKRRKIFSTDAMKKRYAYHESGHAVLNICFNFKIIKISIKSYEDDPFAGQVVFQSKNSELYTLSDLLEQIISTYGGLIAEGLIFGSGSTACESDIESCKLLAHKIVTIGLINGPVYDKKNIERHINIILEETYNQAKILLTRHKDLLEKMTQDLLKVETIRSCEEYKLKNEHDLHYHYDNSEMIERITKRITDLQKSKNKLWSSSSSSYWSSSWSSSWSSWSWPWCHIS